MQADIPVNVIQSAPVFDPLTLNDPRFVEEVKSHLAMSAV